MNRRDFFKRTGAIALVSVVGIEAATLPEPIIIEPETEVLNSSAPIKYDDIQEDERYLALFDEQGKELKYKFYRRQKIKMQSNSYFSFSNQEDIIFRPFTDNEDERIIISAVGLYDNEHILYFAKLEKKVYMYGEDTFKIAQGHLNININ